MMDTRAAGAVAKRGLAYAEWLESELMEALSLLQSIETELLSLRAQIDASIKEIKASREQLARHRTLR
jgi:hypothetical protein